jgi:hypothetical protein
MRLNAALTVFRPSAQLGFAPLARSGGRNTGRLMRSRGSVALAVTAAHLPVRARRLRVAVATAARRREARGLARILAVLIRHALGAHEGRRVTDRPTAARAFGARRALDAHAVRCIANRKLAARAIAVDLARRIAASRAAAASDSAGPLFEAISGVFARPALTRSSTGAGVLVAGNPRKQIESAGIPRTRDERDEDGGSDETGDRHRRRPTRPRGRTRRHWPPDGASD